MARHSQKPSAQRQAQIDRRVAEATARAREDAARIAQNRRDDEDRLSQKRAR